MPDALSAISTRRTPQRESARSDQVANSAGGFTFQVGDDTRLNRFLTLGTEGGTYYQNQAALTKKNAQFVISYAERDPIGLVNAVVAISQAGRAPRNNPALFALAVAASSSDAAGRKAALTALPLVARTGTHLFQFIEYVQQFRGWGRGLTDALGRWYTEPDVGRVEYQVLKYRQREGWTHRDVFRKVKLSGPRSDARNELFNFIVGKEADLADLPLVRAFQAAQAATTASEWVSLIQDNPSLSWEMLPDAAKTEPNVWRAMVDQGMPLTALMRQLPTLTRLGVLGPMSAHTAIVASQLTNGDALRKARVHPVNILVALKTYAQGASTRSKHTWDPERKIIDALDAAFYASFNTIEPANKRTMLALDVSGSMTQHVGDLPVQCNEVSAAMAMVSLATEPQAMIMCFHHGIIPLAISPRQRLDDVARSVAGLNAGGTDCSLPMIHAQQHDLEIDTFVVYTDNETWAGRIHPFQALKEYRHHSGIDARLIVVALTPTEFTIADASDPGMLDIVGFDSAVPTLISDFSRGDL